MGAPLSHSIRRGELTPTVGAFYTNTGNSNHLNNDIRILQCNGYNRRRVNPLAAHIVEDYIKYPNLLGVTIWKDRWTTGKVRNLQCEKNW